MNLFYLFFVSSQLISYALCKRGASVGARLGSLGAARATGAFGSFGRTGGGRPGGVYHSSGINKVLANSRLAYSRGVLRNREHSPIRSPSSKSSGLQSPHGSGAKIAAVENTFVNSVKWTNTKPETANRLSNSDGQTLRLNNGRQTNNYQSKLPVFFGGAMAGYLGGKTVGSLSKSVSRFYHPTYNRYYWLSNAQNDPSRNLNQKTMCVYLLNEDNPDEMLNYDNETRVEKILFECKRDEECCDLDCCPKRYSPSEIVFSNPNLNYVKNAESRTFVSSNSNNANSKLYHILLVNFFCYLFLVIYVMR